MINGYQRPLTLVAILRKESVLNAFLPVTKMKKSMVSLCFMLSVLKSAIVIILIPLICLVFDF
jgi:hypothetical protein